MYKQILLLSLVVAVIKAQDFSVDTYNNNYYYCNSTSRTNDYIALNKKQYYSNINYYDLQLEAFRQKYAARVNTIDIQLDMLIKSLSQNDERLNLLEVLSELNTYCIKKHRLSKTTIASNKMIIESCSTTATAQISSILANPVATRNYLQSYYINTYERDISNCNIKYGKLPLNYTLCVESATFTANSFTADNQKTFDAQMAAANCSADASIKKALDCSFTAQNRTISLATESDLMTNRCLADLDNCNRCTKNYSCSEAFFMRQYQIDYKNSTMINPFYGRSQNSDCLMLKLN